MAQHDYNIANQTFPNTRSDINNALSAVASNNSGTAAPSTTFANQWFYETDTNLLQIRNEDNDAYITIAELDQSNDTVEYFKADSIRTALIEFTDGDDAITIADGGVVTISASGTAVTVGGIPFYSADSSIYTHDVSGTDNTAESNAAYGFNALDAITTGDSNVAIGAQAGTDMNTGNKNVMIGKNAFFNATSAAENVVIGFLAGGSGTATSGYNVIIGNEAAEEVSSMSESTVVGYKAATSNTTGSHIIAIGYQAYDGADTENHNLAIGSAALGGSVAGGEFNTIIGNFAGDAITSADHNVIIGYGAGTDITGGGGVSGQNTCIGSNAGGQLTSGYQNIAIGHSAQNGQGDGVGTDPITGFRNINIGGFNNTTANDTQHAICMGYAIDCPSNQFRFGKPSNVVFNTFTSDNTWTQSSDVRKKKNIKDAVLGLDFINDLRTVTYEWKPNYEFPEDFAEYGEENHMTLDVTMHGMVAQEVKEALDKTGVDRFAGWQEDENGSQYLSKEMFVFPLIKAVQELSAKVKALEEA